MLAKTLLYSTPFHNSLFLPQPLQCAPTSPPLARPSPPLATFCSYFKRSCKIFAPATNFDDLHNAS